MRGFKDDTIGGFNTRIRSSVKRVQPEWEDI